MPACRSGAYFTVAHRFCQTIISVAIADEVLGTAHRQRRLPRPHCAGRGTALIHQVRGIHGMAWLKDSPNHYSMCCLGVMLLVCRIISSVPVHHGALLCLQGGICRAGTEDAPPKKAPMVVNYDDEVLWREFAPSNADLAFNLVMAATLIWIPLTVSAIGRCAFVKYRVTNKRIVVQANAPWRSASRQLLPAALVLCCAVFTMQDLWHICIVLDVR